MPELRGKRKNHKNRRKGWNRIQRRLLILLVLLLLLLFYIRFAPALKADLITSREGDTINCEVVLMDPSLIPCEYIEVIPLSPDGARLVKTEGIGDTVGAFSRKVIRFSVAGADVCEIELGWYALGSRHRLRLTIQ